MAIVLLGLVAVVSGAIAAFSIHNKTASEKTQAAVSATSTLGQTDSTTGTAYSAPVQARVESSGAGTSKTAPATPSTPVAQIVRPMDAEISQDCQEAQSGLADVKANGDGSGDLSHTKQTASLLKAVVDLCNVLKKPSANTPDGDELFLVRESAVKQQFDLKGASIRTSVQDSTQASATYDAAQCTTQKHALVAQADQTYLIWYAQWQDARKGLDACYSTNSVPVCDKQMTDLNVQWQDKLTAQFDTLDAKLTSCAPDDRHFNDVSSVVPPSY